MVPGRCRRVPTRTPGLEEMLEEAALPRSSDGGGEQLLSDLFSHLNIQLVQLPKNCHQDPMGNLAAGDRVERVLGTAAARMQSFQPLELPHVWVTRTAPSPSRGLPCLLASGMAGGAPSSVPPPSS